MMHRKNITKIAKRILHHKEGIRSPQIMHPRRDWTIGLVVATGIFIASAIWSAQSYLSYKDPIVGERGGGEEVVLVYRASLVNTALAEFDERSKTFAELVATAGATTTASPPDAATTTASSAEQTQEAAVETPDTNSATTTPPSPENGSPTTTPTLGD